MEAVDVELGWRVGQPFEFIEPAPKPSAGLCATNLCVVVLVALGLGLACQLV